MDEQNPSNMPSIDELTSTTHQLDEIQSEILSDRPQEQLDEEIGKPNDRHRYIFIVAGFIVIVLDQLSKWYVVQNIPLNDRLVPLPALYPYFQFSHVANTGALFGLFPGNNTIIIVVAIVAASAIVYYNFKSPPESITFHLALGLIFGGIVGNWLDRIRIGHVTDFVDFNLRPLLDIPIADWYVFNIADLSLVVGIILLFILSFRDSRQSAQPIE